MRGNTIRCTYEVALITDTLVLLIDCNQGASLTSDAAAVIAELSAQLPGGIGRRRVYYRDSMDRFDEILVERERFVGLRPGTIGQQAVFARLLDESRD